MGYEGSCRHGIDEETRAKKAILAVMSLFERGGFMQTRCHGQSVTKLVRVLKL
jgi:hypothetical protein